MIWFFERAESRLQFEVRTDPEGPGFELVITEGGLQTIERYADRTALTDRVSDLETSLKAGGWAPPVPVSEARRTDQSASPPTTAFPQSA